MPNSPSLTLSDHAVHGPRQPWDSTTQGGTSAPPPFSLGFLSTLESFSKGVPWPSRGLVSREAMAAVLEPCQSSSHSQDGQMSEGAGLEELFIYEEYVCPFTGSVEIHGRTLGAELHVMSEDRCPALMSDQGSVGSSSGVTTPENSPPLRRLPELPDISLSTAAEKTTPSDDLQSPIVNKDSLCVVQNSSLTQTCVTIERSGAIRRGRACKECSTAKPAPKVKSPVTFEGASATQSSAIRTKQPEFVPLLKRRVPAGAIKKPAGGGNPFSGSSKVTPVNVRTVAPVQTVWTIGVSNEVAPAPTRLVRPFGIGEGQNPPGRFKRAVAHLKQETTLCIVFETEEEDGDGSVTIEPSSQEEVGATELEVPHGPEQRSIPIPQSYSRHTRLFTALRESVMGVFKSGNIGSDVESMRSSGSFGCKDRNAHLPTSDSFGCRDRNRHLEDIVIIVTPADDDDIFN